MVVAIIDIGGKTLNVSAPGYCVLSLTGYQRPLVALCYRSQDISAPANVGLVKEDQGFKDSNRGQSYWYGYWYENYIEEMCTLGTMAMYSSCVLVM